jgi:hypothetical protein
MASIERQLSGPMESLFGNSVTIRIIDFLAVQRESKTAVEIARELDASSQSVDAAIDQLVRVGVLGIDRPEEDNSLENTYYYIRHDTPSANAIVHLYNLVNNTRMHTRVLYSTEAGSIQ